MATKTIPLNLLTKGYYMSWFMGTQAAFNICVTLKDDTRTYVSNQCRKSTTFGVMDEGFEEIVGSNMEIIVDIDSSHNILVVNHPVVVPNVQGLTVAQGYVLCFEDASDQDFNDLYVSLMAWKGKG